MFKQFKNVSNKILNCSKLYESNNNKKKKFYTVLRVRELNIVQLNVLNIWSIYKEILVSDQLGSPSYDRMIFLSTIFQFDTISYIRTILEQSIKVLAKENTNKQNKLKTVSKYSNNLFDSRTQLVSYMYEQKTAH